MSDPEQKPNRTFEELSPHVGRLFRSLLSLGNHPADSIFMMVDIEDMKSISQNAKFDQEVVSLVFQTFPHSVLITFLIGESEYVHAAPNLGVFWNTFELIEEV